MGVRISITKRRLEHLTFSSVMTSTGIVMFVTLQQRSLALCQPTLLFFLSDQNILIAWQTNFKDTTQAA